MTIDAGYLRKPQYCIKKVAKRVKTTMDKGQGENQDRFRGLNPIVNLNKRD
jgi:hypothetical protein